jgi:HAD superfamily hydrolase (TIGR01509 family)
MSGVEGETFSEPGLGLIAVTTMKTSKAVIFDMDGVLADTEPIYMGITRDLFAHFGVTLPPEQLFSYVGIPASRMWSEIRSRFELRQPLSELIRLEKDRQLRDLTDRKQIPEIPGVRQLLGELTWMGTPMAVASSSSPEIVELILSKLAIRHLFAEAVSGRDVAQGKPAPDIFLKAAAALGVEPQNCIVIEDSPPGLAGAKRAGMVCIGFANPNSGKQDLTGADLILNDFSPESRLKVKGLVSDSSFS